MDSVNLFFKKLPWQILPFAVVYVPSPVNAPFIKLPLFIQPVGVVIVPGPFNTLFIKLPSCIPFGVVLYLDHLIYHLKMCLRI